MYTKKANDKRQSRDPHRRVDSGSSDVALDVVLISVVVRCRSLVVVVVELVVRNDLVLFVVRSRLAGDC